MRASGPRRLVQWLLVLPVALYVALAASYFVLRYAGHWAGSDTAILSAAIEAGIDEGTLLPARASYGLGFAYQVVSIFLTTVTGLSVTQLQFLVYPIVAAGLTLVAFVMYRELTSDAVAGALATLFLFLQPDFLFVIFRGSHEKVTWLSAMLAIFLLTKSFGAARQLRRFATYVGLFYLAVYALIASNSFFGSSFIIAIAVGLMAGSVVLRISKRRGASEIASPTVARLTLVVASAMVIWWLSSSFFYPSAMRILRDLKSTLDQLMGVTIGQETAFDSYEIMGWAWVSRTAYLGLMLPSYIVGGISIIIWVMAGRHLLRGESPLNDPPQFLLWLLYAGFGTQFAIAILLARGGGAAAYLQLRLFIVMMLVVFPLVAGAVTRLWREHTGGLRSKLLVSAISLLILWASSGSLLKATNDPWVSNYWTFWTAPEDRAVQWAENHLHYKSVWLGLDGIRVSAHAVVEGFGDKTGNYRDTSDVDLETRDLLVSNTDEALSVRRLAPLPDVRGENRVYDNGTVGHYHLRPQTPYQR